MKYAKRVEDMMSGWLGVCVHTNGVIDIPFTRPIHDVLLSEGLSRTTSLGSEFRLDHLPYPQRSRLRPRPLAHAAVVSAILSQSIT